MIVHCRVGRVKPYVARQQGVHSHPEDCCSVMGKERLGGVYAKIHSTPVWEGGCAGAVVLQAT